MRIRTSLMIATLAAACFNVPVFGQAGSGGSGATGTRGGGTSSSSGAGASGGGGGASSGASSNSNANSSNSGTSNSGTNTTITSGNPQANGGNPPGPNNQPPGSAVGSPGAAIGSPGAAVGTPAYPPPDRKSNNPNSANVNNANNNTNPTTNPSGTAAGSGKDIFIPMLGYWNWGSWGSYNGSYAPGQVGFFSGGYNTGTAATGTTDQNYNNSAANGVNNGASSNLLNGPGSAPLTEQQSRLLKQFESTEAYQTALREVKEAQSAYDTATAKARADLKNSPEYQRALADKQRAAAHVEAVQAAHREGSSAVGAPAAATAPPPATQPTAVPQPVVNAAQQKLNAATEVSDVENDFLARDSSVRQARQRLTAATGKLNALRNQFTASLEADPTGQQAQQKVQQIQTNRSSSEQQQQRPPQGQPRGQ